jgi:hypothetical protein
MNGFRSNNVLSFTQKIGQARRKAELCGMAGLAV